MKHFHRCLEPIHEVPSKGVPCLFPVYILAAIPIKIPLTVWPCSQAKSISWPGRKGTLPKKKKKKVIIFTFLVRSACCMTVSAKARDGCEHLVRGSSKSRPVASVTAWSQHSLGGPSRNNLQMYWTTSFTDKSTQLDDYKGLDLNQLTIWPIIASLPMKMNILGSCPVRMKYILTTNHFYFQKSLIKKMNS